jgi:NTP pyrophosphatase (non-canonical NTP hydrolase)
VEGREGGIEGGSVRSISEIAADIRYTNVSKRFDTPTAENMDRYLLLAVSEIAEAQEELRDGHAVTEVYYHGTKPCGFPTEVADAIIRLLDLAHSVGIDIEAAIEEKLAYNKTRPEKHGRQF